MHSCDRPIAVFDSGLGGISVLRELVRQMPQENYLYFGDSLHAPYGSMPTERIRELTFAAARMLFERGAKALVIACNTATSAAIDALRSHYPERIIIGIEPALKLAVSRHPGGRILVMATEATLREKKFALLTEHCASDCEIIKRPCPKLVEFVEHGELADPAVEACIREYLGDCSVRAFWRRTGRRRRRCWAARTTPSCARRFAGFWVRTRKSWTAPTGPHGRQSAACPRRACCGRQRAAALS